MLSILNAAAHKPFYIYLSVKINNFCPQCCQFPVVQNTKLETPVCDNPTSNSAFIWIWTTHLWSFQDCILHRHDKNMEKYCDIFCLSHTQTENTAGKHVSTRLKKSSAGFFEAKRLEAVMKANWGHGGSNKTVRHEDNMQLRIGQYINLLSSCTLPVKAMFPRCVSSYWNCAADLMRVIQCVWRSFSSALSSVTSVNHPSTTFPLFLSSVTSRF